ncbi:hypothetical protein TNCV_234181 [Trichonephila clavipes]|uniref:Uncharacterized protein n=1 Tax=Trichonephila clavipes TaxID=2585209 RepID=A0A8X6SXV4_TRICX|nr:hypothetical protein TNCV_234181 [Trichonephila clavipes]
MEAIIGPSFIPSNLGPVDDEEMIPTKQATGDTSLDVPLHQAHVTKFKLWKTCEPGIAILECRILPERESEEYS